MSGPEVVAVAVIAGCVLAAVGVLALGRTDEDRARIRAEWAAANGEGAPRPWGGDAGAGQISVLGVLACAALLLGALAFAQSMASKATTPATTCDLAVQSECPHT